MAYLLLFTGKGGVGKSTISASTAVYHASQGLRTLLVSSDPAHSTDDTLGIKVGSEATQVSENLWAKNLNAESLRRFLRTTHRIHGIIVWFITRF